MTVGQRIAQKRKELGLSQEQLGEQLGVSRQAIYKWESDAALPEVEKLISLSRLFGVSVGWLLGVEEAEAPEKPAGELTEEQLRMVQEIVDRYLAARPEPEPVKVRRWPRVVGALAIIAGVIVAIKLSGDFKNMKNQVSGLQNSLSNVSRNVSSEIGSITNRVEEILKSQNQLTAEYEVNPISSDLTANTVTFAAAAVPKTYVAGMRAVFLARSGSQTVSVEGVLDGEGNRFFATLTCPLTNDITLSVVFSASGKEETQLLESYDWMLSATLPDVYVNGTLWAADVDANGVLVKDNQSVAVQPGSLSSYGDWYQPSKIQTVRVGLFRNHKLLFWYTEGDEPQGWDQEGWHFFRRTQDVTLELDAEYVEAAVITDQYGRTFVVQDTPVVYSSGDHTLNHSVSSYDSVTDPSGWEY